jgi:signal transduction histidine kinase
MTRGIHQQPMAMQSVLIITDDAAFGRDLMARWQAELHVPEFTLVNTELWQNADLTRCDLAIVGKMQSERIHRLLLLLASAPAVLALLPEQVSLHQVRSEFSNVLPLRWAEDVLETAVMFGSELLRRRALEQQLDRAEQLAATGQQYVSLGRYMVENRHGFNNALTSVLGNAELLQLDGAQFGEEVREQVDTIHSMALRLYELMQRFTSLETEMQFAEREPKAAPAQVMRFARRL